MFIKKELTRQFDELFSYTKEINQLNGGSGTALLVIHRDKIVAEYYHGTHTHEPDARDIQEDSQFNIASARKSYIGFAIAWALHQGKIQSLDDLVTDYLPELDREAMRDTTFRHLLTHTHGVEQDDAGHLYREFLPGTHWAYRGAGILMLTKIVHRTTGKTVSQLLKELVFSQLNFTETAWRTQADEKVVPVILDPKWKTEVPLGSNGDGDQSTLYTTARELAYWGYLHLKRGKIEGKQIVPKEIIELATTVQSPEMENQDLPQNGFLWYVKDRNAKQSEIGDRVPAGSYQILGITGPLVLVIPKHDLVVVRMYNKRYNYSGPDGSNYLHYLREFGDQVMACVERVPQM